NRRAAALEVEVLARGAIGMKYHDEVREAGALVAPTTAVSRVLDEHDDSIARGVHGRTDRHAEIDGVLLGAAVAQLRAVALNHGMTLGIGVWKPVLIAVVVV